jgi:hypothetical protein
MLGDAMGGAPPVITPLLTLAFWKLGQAANPAAQSGKTKRNASAAPRSLRLPLMILFILIHPPFIMDYHLCFQPTSRQPPDQPCRRLAMFYAVSPPLKKNK